MGLVGGGDGGCVEEDWVFVVGEGAVAALGGDCGDGGDVVEVERVRGDGQDVDGVFDVEEGRRGYVFRGFWRALMFDRASFEK